MLGVLPDLPTVGRAGSERSTGNPTGQCVLSYADLSREVIVVLHKLLVLYGWTLDTMAGNYFWCLPTKTQYGKETCFKSG